MWNKRWKVLCDTFHNVESTICISTMWKLQFVFPQCGNYNVNFTLRTKKGLRFSTKLRVKWFLLHNVQGENRAVKALKWSATESCIQLVWMPWNDSLPCQKCLKSRIICFAKMSKITLLLWKDFDPNFMLAEGFWSIPCLFIGEYMGNSVYL